MFQTQIQMEGNDSGALCPALRLMVEVWDMIGSIGRACVDIASSRG
jgi:hypothetical protein